MLIFQQCYIDSTGKPPTLDWDPTGLSSSEIANEISALRLLYIYIKRVKETSTRTIGRLYINRSLHGWTLEEPWKDNEQYVSRIYPGTYAAFRRLDRKNKFELLNVKDRSVVQIHAGNDPDDTEGCILPGLRLSSDGLSIAGGTSAPAMDDIRRTYDSLSLKRMMVVVEDDFVDPIVARFSGGVDDDDGNYLGTYDMVLRLYQGKWSGYVRWNLNDDTLGTTIRFSIRDWSGVDLFELEVSLAGANRGVTRQDFGTQRSGDLLDKWTLVRNSGHDFDFY